MKDQMAAMGVFNEELKKAGVMKDCDGLRPSREGKRVRFDRKAGADPDGSGNRFTPHRQEIALQPPPLRAPIGYGRRRKRRRDSSRRRRVRAARLRVLHRAQPLAVAEVVLRDRMRPACDRGPRRIAASADERLEIAVHDRRDFGVRSGRSSG